MIAVWLAGMALSTSAMIAEKQEDDVSALTKLLVVGRVVCGKEIFFKF
jgi:hypothetical protein